MAIIKLRKEGLARLRRNQASISDPELARQAELHPTQLYRLLNDDTNPGMRTVAGLCLVFGAARFADLFDVIPDSEADA